MRIVNLAENTAGDSGCGAEHGLSFYIETGTHKVLMDTGASALFLENAEKLGIDLTKVDTVVISHGHYDHGGGISAFSAINPEAVIYLQEGAFDAFYSQHDPDEEPHYIGLEQGLRDLPQLKRIRGSFRIDDTLELFSDIGSSRPSPEGNRDLKRRTSSGDVEDDFRHEQCLVVTDSGRHILFSGCAHHGILNILERYRELYGRDPDAVISGFHMMKHGAYTEEETQQIIDTALALRKCRTVFYTGHCTGIPAYEAMHRIMGSQLRYVHSGDAIPDDALVYAPSAADANAEKRRFTALGHTQSRSPKGRSSYMKWHRFFAWSAVFCFIMTMITGYKRK